MRKRILLIGQGSIGKRLTKHLLSNDAVVLAYHHRNGLEGIEGTTAVHTLNEPVDGVVIASPSSDHLQYLEYFAGKCAIFVEKPVSDAFNSQLKKNLKLLSQSHYFVMAGFQMRYVPIIQKVTQLLQEKALGNILHASLYVGQYLPFWRKNSNYLESYSAKYELGGGVSLDLIHEIDLACSWFGIEKNIQIVSKKLGNLQVNTENFVQINTKQQPFIQILLDSLNHIKTRQYTIVGDRASIVVDLYNQHMELVSLDGVSHKYTDATLFDVNNAYNTEIKYFLDHIRDVPPSDLDRWLGIDALRIAEKGRHKFE